MNSSLVRALARWCRHGGVAAALTVLFLAGDASAQVGPQPDAAYRAAIATGIQEFNLGHYQEALAAFTEAGRIHPGSRVLRGIASVRFETREYVEAIRVAEEALNHPDGALTPQMRAELESLRARAYGFTGLVNVHVTPDSAQVLLDGRMVSPRELGSPIRVAVGPHELTVSAQGYSTERRTVDVASAGQTQVLVVALTTGGRNPLPYVAAAGALVGAGGAVGSIIWYLNRGDAVSRCDNAMNLGGDCANASTLSTQRTIALSTLIGTSVLTVAGAITFFASIGGHATPGPSQPMVACAPGPDGMFCSGRIVW